MAGCGGGDDAFLAAGVAGDCDETLAAVRCGSVLAGASCGSVLCSDLLRAVLRDLCSVPVLCRVLRVLAA